MPARNPPASALGYEPAALIAPLVQAYSIDIRMNHLVLCLRPHCPLPSHMPRMFLLVRLVQISPLHAHQTVLYHQLLGSSGQAVVPNQVVRKLDKPQ